MSVDSLIGRKLGDYSIKSLLGRGGMSRVYRGYDENLDRFAAVKVISGDFATTTEEEYTRRFQIEARAIARLQHPNIVGVYQFGRTEGIYYMAMVFLEGKDLRNLLKTYAEQGQRMSPAEMLRIARDLANALDYAHEQGVIHRDIKPSNIMLEKKTGRAILMDFGLALSVNEGTTGDTFGSAHYIAPEQAISSAKAVPQSDLYSLGIVLYEMMAGKVPFDDPSAMSVALKHLNEVPPPLSLYNPNLPLAVEQVIMRVLDKSPDRRYPTGRDLVDALAEAFRSADPALVVEASSNHSTAITDSQAALLSSSPSVPLKQTSLPAPTVSESEVNRRGIAGRFARRKARKEEEAALQSMSEEALQIDDQTLDLMLDSYADPRDIGLVGPEATGITRSERPSIASSVMRPQERQKRRSRLGLLLTVLLILAAAGGAAWFGLNDNGGDDDPEVTGLVGTDDVTSAVALVLTEPATEESAQNATDEATSTPTRTPTRRPTQEPAEAVTEEASIVSGEPGVETVEATDTSEAPTDTPEPTSRPEVTLSPTGSPTPEPNIKLVYNSEGEFLLVNISTRQVNLTGLGFEQIQSDGTRYSFEANAWNDLNIAERPYMMGGGGCYQLLTNSATRLPPSASDCPRFLGWLRTYTDDRYFWLQGDTFDVYVGEERTVLATCEIAAGECTFYLPPA